MRHSSFKHINRRKRVKLNVFTPLNSGSDSPSVHQTYTFVSRSKGFQTRSSHVISSGSSQANPQAQTEAGTTFSELYDEQFDFNGHNIYDMELNEDAEGHTKKKRTVGASVGLPLYPVICPSHLFFRTSHFCRG